MTDVSGVLVGVLDSVAKRNPKKWSGSLHATMMDLEIDCRGEVGENFLAESLTLLGHEVRIDRTTDASSKPWDLLVDGRVMLEVKTATQGKTHTFQHESISIERGYDALVLVDIAPDDVYLTCAPKTDIPFRKKNSLWTVREKKMHLRHDGRGKWDLNLKDVEPRRIVTLDDVRAQYDLMLQRLPMSKMGRRVSTGRMICP